MRAITADELIKLRQDGQWSRLFLAGLENPPVVFSARVNQAFASHAGWNNKVRDQILQVNYDGGTGVLADILTGMTMWIGSAAGLYDIGQVRIRKAPSGSGSTPNITGTFYIGEESDIDWDDNLYLTVVDEFLLWPRHIKMTAGVPYMDGDVAYSAQHDEFAPVPVMGSDIVLDVDAYPVSIDLDGSESWVFGGTISAYLWAANAGSWGGTQASTTPTLTLSEYPTNGLVRISLRVTSSHGGTQTTGYRYVRLYDSAHPAETDFQVSQFTENYETGGWSFDVTVYGSQASVRDRAPIILFARDYYNGVRGEIGQQAGRENIICSGWINGESIDYDQDEGSVRFTVVGAQFWMGKMPGFPPGVSMQTGSTGAWASIPNLTVDRALWHLLHWRSTATTIMDIQLTSDTRYADGFEVPTESLWSQIKEIAGRILAAPGVDHYGRLFIEVDPQYVPVDERTWTEVMDITQVDWIEKINYLREVANKTSLLELSGVAIPLHVPAKPYFSLSTGHIFARHGEIESIDRLLLDTQVQSNELAGLVMGKRNNPYPNFKLDLGANNRMIDCFPRQYCNITISANDTPRGKEYSGRIIPRDITLVWDPEAGCLLPSITFEAESFPALAIDGDPPSNPNEPPSINPVEPPVIIINEPPEEGPHTVMIYTQNYGFLYTANFQDGDDAEWFFMNDGLSEAQYKDVGGSLPPVRGVFMSPTGMIYALIHDPTDPFHVSNGRGATHVFACGGVGEAWFEWFYVGDDPYLDVGYVPDDTRIIIMDVNPNTGGLFLVFGEKNKMEIGIATDDSMSVISHGDPLDPHLDTNTRQGQAVYEVSGDKWRVVHGEQNIFGSAAHSSVSSDGTYDLTEHSDMNDFGDLTPPADADYNLYLNPSGLLYFAKLDWVCKVSGAFKDIVTGDIYTTGIAASTVNMQKNGMLAASPDGQYLMGGVGGVVTGRRSSDGGATWGAVGGSETLACKAWANCGDSLQWIAAVGAHVYWSDDWGDTWNDHSGNLSVLVGGTDPVPWFIVVLPITEAG